MGFACHVSPLTARTGGSRSGRAFAGLGALALVALAMATPSLAQTPPPSARAEMAVATPQIEGKTVEGKPFTLPSLKGKVVLVLYWSTACAVCRDKMPELRTNYEGWAGKPFELVAVNTDARMKDMRDYEKHHLAHRADSPALRAALGRRQQLPRQPGQPCATAGGLPDRQVRKNCRAVCGPHSAASLGPHCRLAVSERLRGSPKKKPVRKLVQDRPSFNQTEKSFCAG